MTTTVLVAGGSGDLGTRIVRQLRRLETEVRILARPGSGARDHFADDAGITVAETDYADATDLERTMRGVDVVVSALSGARPVIIDAQRALLEAAIAAGVPRFMPSDYSADYRRIPPGSNRNLELRREFAAELDAMPIAATSVLIGAFADMLTGQAPLIIPRLRRVLFWSDADQVLDFTTKDDTARTVARVALDPHASRVVEVAGDRISARGLAQVMTEITQTTYHPQWAGSVGSLAVMARGVEAVSRDDESAFPAWQGMQYVVSMFSGHAQLRHTDNDRYGVDHWTTAAEVMAAHLDRHR